MRLPMLPELEVVFERDDTMRESTSLGYTTSYYIDTHAGGKSGNPVCLKSQKFIVAVAPPMDEKLAHRRSYGLSFLVSYSRRIFW
jgi:hypothetical protein